MEPSEQIDGLIAGLDDWRGPTLARLRRIILEADPEIVEEWKWMGSPTWSRDGVVLIGNAFKSKVQLVFLDGASLPDPDGLFNTELKGTKRRGIDSFEGDSIDEDSLKALVRAGVALRLNRKAAKK